MRKKITLLLIIILLPLSFLHAQEENETWYIGKRVNDIVFDGLKTVRARELQPIVSPLIGNPFSEKSFQEIQSRLYALDFFSEISASAEPLNDAREEVIIVFTIIERPVIQKIVTTGNKNASRIEILRELTLRKGSFVSNIAIREDTAIIESLYTKRGFIDTEIVMTFQNETETLVITVKEGTQIHVKKLEFIGNNIFPSKKLKRAIETKTMSLLRKGYFLESMLNADVQKILEYYTERGYIDAEVVNIEREVIEYKPETKKQFLSLKFYINEGTLFYYGGISFEGNETFSDEFLSKFITHKVDKILDLPRLQRQMQSISEKYFENGYIYNEITPIESRQGNKVFYTIKIRETPRAHIENIIIQGNRKTRDFVIRREIDLSVGEVYNNLKLRQAYFNLANLRFFDSVDLRPVPGSSNGLMDLVFSFEEGETMDITAGLGLALGASSATTIPISINLRWSERNLAGTGLQLSSGLTLSMESQRLDISLLSNWLFGERIFAGASFFVWHDVVQYVRQDILQPLFSDEVPDLYTGEYVFSSSQEYNNVSYSTGEYFPGNPTASEITDLGLKKDFKEASTSGKFYNSNQNLMSYDSIRFGLSLQLGYRYLTTYGSLVPRIFTNFSFDYIAYDPLLYRPNNAQTRANLNKILNVNSFGISLAWDMRDIRHNPTQGMYASQGFIFTGGILAGTRHFVRSNSRLDFYVPLVNIPVSETWSWKMVLGMQTVFSILLPYFDASEFDNSGPADSDKLMLDGIFYARGWPVEREGEAMWNSWIEIRMELAQNIIWFDLFFEAARLWSDYSNLAIAGIETMKFTMGAGIRFVISQFPLRFYFGKRFRIDRNGQAIWQTGNIGGSSSSPGSGVDFIFSMTYEFF